MSVNHFDPHLQELKERSVLKLLKVEIFDLAAFRALQSYLWEKAEDLKHEYTISKQILLCIREAISIIESRAEYVPEAKAHRFMANEFALMLDMIIAGEAASDRKPGVPRVL